MKPVFVLLAFAFSVSAQDWPQWGGAPARNMYANATHLPDHFTTDKSAEIKFKAGSDEVDRSNLQNLKWVAKIGSQSYGNVTVAGGKVFEAVFGLMNAHGRIPVCGTIAEYNDPSASARVDQELPQCIGRLFQPCFC